MQVQAQEVGPILITPEERIKIIEQFQQMQNVIEKLQKEYKTCQQASRA